MIGDALLIIVFSVKACMFVFSNFRNASRGKRDGEREGELTPILTYLIYPLTLM